MRTSQSAAAEITHHEYPHETSQNTRAVFMVSSSSQASIPPKRYGFPHEFNTISKIENAARRNDSRTLIKTIY
jgi:hypothetical protein